MILDDDDAFEALTARVRTEVEANVARDVAAGYVLPPDEHGMRAGVKWPVRDDAGEVIGWEGGRLCHCGELFVRTVAQGGMRAADIALIEHEGWTVSAS